MWHLHLVSGTFWSEETIATKSVKQAIMQLKFQINQLVPNNMTVPLVRLEKWYRRCKMKLSLKRRSFWLTLFKDGDILDSILYADEMTVKILRVMVRRKCGENVSNGGTDLLSWKKKSVIITEKAVIIDCWWQWNDFWLVQKHHNWSELTKNSMTSTWQKNMLLKQLQSFL